MIRAIIPNLNGIEHLSDCLPTLFEQTCSDIEVIVVDNGSTDTSLEFLKLQYSQVEIVPLTENMGFSKAVNIGIRRALQYADTTHILLLNNDIQCDKMFVEELLSGFIQKDVGSVAPKMLNYYDRTIIDDAGDFVSKSGLPFSRGQGQKDEGQFDLPEFILGPCAGAALYKREVFEKAGLFDEDFFAYYEDIDLNLRMQMLGFKCYYNPRAICYHKRGGTMSSNRNFHIYLIERNLVLLRVKNYPLSVLILYSPVYLIGRLHRFAGYLLFRSFSFFFQGLKGYINGTCLIVKNLPKRKKIRSECILNRNEIWKLLS